MVFCIISMMGIMVATALGETVNYNKKYSVPKQYSLSENKCKESPFKKGQFMDIIRKLSVSRPEVKILKSVTTNEYEQITIVNSQRDSAIVTTVNHENNTICFLKFKRGA